ncbi:MAG: alpha/beta hydrolase, partial [Methylocystis sp.]|nr:alpha/beta hydrolase [Methylocystis sp.]
SADGAGRRVLALDYRGRGLSDWDPEWAHYNLEVEQQDILATLAAAKVRSAVFIGTSRGGVHIMRLAAARPELLRAAVINDIGPTVELAGLLRIKDYVGKLPQPASFREAVALVRRLAGAYFTNLPDADWETYVQHTFVEQDGRWRAQYDPAVAHALDSVGADKPPTQFWPQFAALARVPVLGIRGSNSDLLSPETFAEMQKRHPAFEALIVEGQGHAPLLLDAPTIAAIMEFIGRCP